MVLWKGIVDSLDMLTCIILVILHSIQMAGGQVRFDKTIIKGECRTPNGYVGQCVPLQECKHLIQLLHSGEQGRREVHMHRCYSKDSGAYACCKVDNPLKTLLSTTDHVINASTEQELTSTTTLKPSTTITTVSVDSFANGENAPDISKPELPTNEPSPLEAFSRNFTDEQPPTMPWKVDSISYTTPPPFKMNSNNVVDPLTTPPPPIVDDTQPITTSPPSIVDDVNPLTTPPPSIVDDVNPLTTPPPSIGDVVQPLTTAHSDSSLFVSRQLTTKVTINNILPTTSSYPNHTRNVSVFRQRSTSTMSSASGQEVSLSSSTSPTIETIPQDATPTKKAGTTDFEMENTENWKLADQVDVRNVPLMEPTLEAELERSPWLVDIQFGETNAWKGNCIGTLISNRHVLTLVKCLHQQQSKANISSMTFGSSGLPLIVNCSSPECPIKGISQHLVDNNAGFTDGVAVIILNDPVVFSDSVRALDLPDYPANQDNFLNSFNNIVTTGWKDKTSHSHMFRTPIPLSACTEWQPRIRKGIHLCTVPTFESTVGSPCLPSIGKAAPLLGWDDERSTFVLLGILQREKDECAGTRQSVYLDICLHLKWIAIILQE